MKIKTHDCYEREDELAHCKVCGGAEGTLPTDCPMRKLTNDEEAAIWAGIVDYKNGQWILGTKYRN